MMSLVVTRGFATSSASAASATCWACPATRPCGTWRPHGPRTQGAAGGRDLRAIEVFQMPLDVTGREAACIQAQDFVVEALETALALGDKPRHKASLAVTRDLQGQRPRVRLHRLRALAIPGVLVLCPVACIGHIAQ